jgi:flagellar protein FliS
MPLDALLLARSARPGAAPPPPPAARAASQYRAISLEARVAAASPHGLILLLYERLDRLLAEALAPATAPGRRLHAIEHALAIVDGLDSTLDDARGGDVAQSLHAAYALARAQLRQGDAASLAAARQSCAALMDAWRAIGTPAVSDPRASPAPVRPD